MSQRKRTTGATSSHATDATTGKDSASSALPPPPAQGFRLKLLAAAALVGSATALYHFAGTAPLDTRMKPAVVGVAPAAHLHGTAASTAAATSTIHHLTTASGQPVYELDPNITTAVHAAGHVDWRSFIPQHPQPRFFDEQGAPKKKKSVDGKVVAVITPQQAVDEILTENQYSVGVSAGGVKARVDQTSVASNAPIEDRHSEHHYRLDIAGKQRDLLLLGMYDGHSGFECSDMLRNQLPKYTVQELVRRQSTDPAAVTDALTTAFERLDGDMRAVAEDPRYQYDARAVLPALAGAVTILTCVVDRTLYVANAGDVRAVLGRESPSGGDFEAVALSIDHDAHNPAERARMFQEHPGEEEVVLKNDRVLGGLQPLRSFGDSIYKWTQTVTDTIRAGMQAGPSKPYAKRARSSRQIVTPPYVTARPEVVKHELGERDRFMVLATDGLWESMSNEQVVEFVGKVYREQICPAGKSIVEKDAVPTMIKSGENAATAVLRQSLVHRYPQDKWDAALHYILSIPAPYCRNVRDDITITVVFFDRPDGKCADSLATEHQLPITTGVDPSSWREVVEDEIKRSSSKL